MLIGTKSAIVWKKNLKANLSAIKKKKKKLKSKMKSYLDETTHFHGKKILK